MKKLFATVAHIPYRLLVWLWAWTREFMVVGAAIIGGTHYEGAPIAMASLCAILWWVTNVFVGLYGEDMKNRILRDFMIRHKAHAFVPTPGGNLPRVYDDDDYDDKRIVWEEKDGSCYNKRGRRIF